MKTCLLKYAFVWKQIVADIYEPQGIAFVDATATFLTNELLSLVEKSVTDTKVEDQQIYLLLLKDLQLPCEA